MRNNGTHSMSEVVRRRLASLAAGPGEAEWLGAPPEPVVLTHADANPKDGDPVRGWAARELNAAEVSPGGGEPDVVGRGEPRRGAVDPGGQVWGRVVEFGRAHLAAVAVVMLLGVVAAVWAISQSRVTVLQTPAPAVTESVVAATPSPSPTPTIQVHVIGAVANPGVVTLAEGARVHEAIAAAGGLLPNARPGALNLAAVVSDGAQVTIGSPGSPASQVTGASGEAAASGGGGGKLNLNTATAAQLEALPGIGPVTAGNIVAWRTKHKRFSRVEELLEVDGVGLKTVARLAEQVRVA